MADHSNMPDGVVSARECSQRHLQSPDPSTTPVSDRLGGRSPPALVITQAVRTLAWLGILVLFLWLTLKVDLVIFAGVLFAICLRRVADRVSGLTGIPVGGTLALVELLVLAFFAGMGWFFSQAIASQVDQLSQQLPAAAAKVGSIIGQSSVGKIITEHISSTGIKQSPLTMLQKFFGVVTNAGEVVGALVVMTFLGIYFAAEANLYISGLVRLVPRGWCHAAGATRLVPRGWCHAPGARAAPKSCTRPRARSGIGCWVASYR